LRPNPATDKITVHYELPERNQSNAIQIFNTSGQVVYSQALASGNGNIKIDVSALSQGVYYCTLFSGNSVKESVKFVVR